MSLRRRIDSLEAALQLAQWQRVRRAYATVAAEYGLDANDLMAEAEAFFAMSLDAQLAEVDRLASDLIAEGICPAVEIDAIKATLRREYRPLQEA